MFKEYNLQWEITNMCNLECKHCYLDEEQRMPSVEQLISDFEEYAKMPKRFGSKINVSLTGGEPLLHSEMLNLVNYLRNQPEVAEISIFSNGILIDDAMIEGLKKYNIHRVQVSLDGGDPETHDAVRGQGTFKMSVENIKRLRDAGIRVTTHFTIHKLNIHSFSNLVDLCLEADIDRLLISRLIPIGSGEQMKECLLLPEEWYEFYSKHHHLQSEHSEKLEIVFDKVLEHRHNPKSIGCNLGGSTTAMLSNGDIMFCRRIPKVIGNVREESIIDIWFKNQTLHQIRNKKNVKGICKDCKYLKNCGGCRADAYGFYGDMFAQEPYCLEYFERKFEDENIIN